MSCYEWFTSTMKYPISVGQKARWICYPVTQRVINRLWTKVKTGR
jgi:hypothetical protein